MVESTCSVPGCAKPVRTKGMCATHYNRTLPNRHPMQRIPCAQCGAELVKQRTKRLSFCDYACRDAYLRANRMGAWSGAVSRAAHARVSGSPLVAALDDGDAVAFFVALRARCTVTASECWEWPQRDGSGYPLWPVRGSKFRVHRLVLEVKHGRPLGQQAAHHRCANTQCVNPEHLQPVTHAGNNVEMMQRTYYLARIAELEQALSEASPSHPLIG